MAEYEKKKSPGNKRAGLAGVLFMAGVLCSGLAAAFLAARINGTHFGCCLWPFAACVSLFIFTAAGFFMTEGKAELLFGGCSIMSAVCIIVQLAILF